MIRRSALLAVLAIGIVGTAAIVAAFAYLDVSGLSVSTITTSSTKCTTGSCTSTQSSTTSMESTTMSDTTTQSTSSTASTTASMGTTSTTGTCCNDSRRMLGFWLQEGDITGYTWQGGYQVQGATHPSQLFFHSMFLTPPYPSTLEVMIFAILQDHRNGITPGVNGSYTASSLAFWNDLATLCDSYPNIRLVFEIAFLPGDSVYGLPAFQLIVDSLGKHSSVQGLGIEGEYTQPQTTALFSSAQAIVLPTGKQFISYYVRTTTPPGALVITHTNFPAAGDQVNTLGVTGPNVVGIDSGYYYSFPFPQNAITCPIGPNVIVTGVVEGWNQCVVSTELSVAVGLPATNRQFVELDPGFSSSGSFVGVSGLNTTQLWDNPTLRNWLWTDPNYQPNFTLSS